MNDGSALAGRRLFGANRPDASAAESERAVAVLGTAITLGLGVAVVALPSGWLALVAIGLGIAISAWTLPLSVALLVMAALIPLQLYVPLPGSSFTLRVAVLYVIALALRTGGYPSRARGWMVPSALFVAVAAVAGVTASNRYLAFRGIYDWLPVFAAAWIASRVDRSKAHAGWLAGALIAGGIAEAVLGLLEYAAGLETVLQVLRLPLSNLFFSPNLLAERLAGLSFNWVVFERAAPFGTFINGIDFAVYIAAVLSLVLGLLIAPSAKTQQPRFRQLLLLACAFVLGGTLILTYKGTGFLALAGGVLGIVVLTILRPARFEVSARTAGIGLAVLAGAAILVVPVAGLLGERVQFLIQREQGLSGTTGRLGTWASFLQAWAARPLFGYGLNNSVVLAEGTRTLNAGVFALISTNPESAYVAALIETGLAGFLALVSLIIATLVRGLLLLPRVAEPALMTGILAAIAAIGSGNLTVVGLTTDQTGMLFGVCIGLVWSEWIHR